MFSRWLRRSNRLQHADAQVRLGAVRALNADQALTQEAELVSLALSDPDLEVRKAAVLQVNKPNQLAALLDDQAMGEHTARHIATLIQRGVAAQCRHHPGVLVARMALASPGDFASLVNEIQDTQLLAQLALKHRNSERETLLQHPRLQSEQGLVDLERGSRGHDKRLNRYARDKLDQLKSGRSACEQLLARVAELDSAIHKELKIQPQEAEQLIVHRQKLAKLGKMRSETADEFVAATQRLNGLNGEYADLCLPGDPLAGVDLFVPDAANDPFAELADQWLSLADAMQHTQAIDTVTTRRNKLADAWLAQADKFPPTRAQHRIFEDVSKQYQAYLSAWDRYNKINWLEAKLPEEENDPAIARWKTTWEAKLRELKWPKDHKPPAEVATIEAALARISTTLTQHNAQTRAQRSKLDELIRQAQAALADGHVRDTAAHLKAARQIFNTLNDKAKARKLEQTLNALSAQLSELQDWRKFATSPKRQNLLTELQGLCDHPLPPKAQADQLKRLRQQWQQLGRANSTEEARLHEQFDQLAEQAYAPCKTYYAEQNEQRAENLRQRQAICAQVKTYLDNTDWDNAEIKAAESILRTAREAWRRYHPCERKALKPVETEFEALQAQLHGHIKTAWDKNIAHKSALIEELKALLAQDVGQQVNGAKALQQQWRAVGPTPRGADQRLWREFRQICDQIFAQRDADKAADLAQREHQQQALEAAVGKLEQAAADTTPQTASAASQRSLNAAITECGQPTPAQQQRISAANQTYDDLLSAAKHQKHQAQLEQWRIWDIEVSLAENNHQPMEPPDALFAARLEGKTAPEDWLKLTLTAEIAADLSSPEENQGERMALQIELMNAGVRKFTDADKKELLNRWCSAGPKDTAAEVLRDRFFAAIGHR